MKARFHSYFNLVKELIKRGANPNDYRFKPDCEEEIFEEEDSEECLE